MLLVSPTLAAVGALALIVLVPSTGFACGASAGSGGVAVCTLEDIREKARKKFRVGSTYAFSSTKIVFSSNAWEDREKFTQERHAALGTFEWRATRRFALQGSAGALVEGKLAHSLLDGSAQMSSGPVFALGASWLALSAKKARPFVLFTGQFSAVFSQALDARYSATDLRLGTAIGWNIERVVSLYGLGRVFGGPVHWTLDGNDLVGTDLYHYQVGGGVSWLIDYRLDLFVEGVALGERGVVAGLGVAF